MANRSPLFVIGSTVKPAVAVFLSIACTLRYLSRVACMYCVTSFSGVWINRVRLSILIVASITRKLDFPCPHSRLRHRSHETGSAVLSRVSPLILHAQAEYGAYSRDSSCFPRRRPSIPSTAIGSVSSSSVHAIVYQKCSQVRGHRHRASSPQVVSP